MAEWPTQQWIGGTLMLAAVVTFILGVEIDGAHVRIGRIFPLQGFIWPFGSGMPLSCAATMLYGRTRNTVISEFAERSSEDPSGVLNWYAYWMTQHGVRVWGKKPPSTIRELIPPDHIAGPLHFCNGATELFESYNKRPSFVDLTVSRLDLFRLRKRLLAKEHVG